ncbi:MAG TPA: helix-hairpin-helix domain-containing protein [Rhodanobacter sp.]
MFKKLAAAAFALLLVAPGLLLAATPVNINTADAATIAKALDRIGQSKAQAIVAYREAHGPFKKVDDLNHVKGIGKATIELNRSAILLADDADAAAAPAPAATEAETPAKPTHEGRKKAAAATDSE